jgi:hypothetical protein
MQHIDYPAQTTYYICYDNLTDIDPAYGWVDPDQVMTSGRAQMWTSLIEQDWINELQTQWNITYPPPPDPPTL